MKALEIIEIMILGYALGSIPFGVVLAHLFRLPDPRHHGSGNIGATNMLRTGNKKVALLTLLLDAGKGALAAYLAFWMFPVFDGARAAVDACGMTEESLKQCITADPRLTALAVLAAALGHMYSPWLKFKGGKGVATLFGGALAFSWPVGMASLCVWLIVTLCTRYVSLASIITLAVAPCIIWLRVDATSAFILAVASAIAIAKHRANIVRLLRGEESRLRFGKREG